MSTLKKMADYPGPRGPVVLCVMDGVGIGKYPEGDFVREAWKPNLEWLGKNALVSQLLAHGTAVGMPGDDDMGNSEVGHNAVGCGRVFAQGARLVALPEHFACLGRDADTAAAAQPADGPLVTRFRELAGKLGIFLLMGSFPERAPGKARPYNTSLLLGPEPLIGAQQVLIVSQAHPERAVRVATDGLRPFSAQALP